MGVATVKRPPLAILLMHLGACPEAIVWAGKREMTAQSVTECPRGDWLEWIVAKLKVPKVAPWATWLVAIDKALAGDGYGYGNVAGYGSGDGDGYGYGYGNGYGNGDGNGNGDGDGDGYGYGAGYGYGILVTA